MSKRRFRPPYPEEFKQQIVDLVRAGRSIASLAEEFEPSEPTIRHWVLQAKARDGDEEFNSLSHQERSELNRLRRENKQLKVEREILSKAAAWFARETERSGSTDS